MARINKAEALQEMQEGLRLDTAKEKTPDQLADKILATYQINPKPRVIKLIDTDANDSNKSFQVPDGKKWKVLYGKFSLVSTATAGNRTMVLDVVDDASNILYSIRSLNVQAASVTEIYSIGQFGDVSESVAGVHLLPIPTNFFLLEGYFLRVRDSAAIDSAADDLSLFFVIEETDMNPNK
jgi:hypothetical protein